MRATMRFLAMSGVMTGLAAHAAPGSLPEVVGADLASAVDACTEVGGKALADADFASENFCERYVEWNRETQRFDYAPVGTVRAIQ